MTELQFQDVPNGFPQYKPHSTPNVNIRSLKSRGTKPANGFIQIEGKGALSQTLYNQNEKLKHESSFINEKFKNESSFIKNKDDQSSSIIMDDINPTNPKKMEYPQNEKQLSIFDAMLHKRLEHLRKLLLDEDKIMSYKPQQIQQIDSKVSPFSVNVVINHLL